MKQLPIALLLSFSLPACAASPSRTDTAASYAQSSEPSSTPLHVSALIEAHDAAWNAHDPDALAGLFVADGTLVTPTGTRVEGLQALRANFAAPSPTKQTTSSTEVLGVQPVDDDLAVIDVRQTLSGPGVETLGTDQAHAVLVVRAVDGTWKIVSARPYIPAALPARD
jgi:uncharacterized protein (TIGR02246 family)